MIDPYILPDGSRYEAWDCSTEYKKTYHVNQRAANASDENPGTAGQPFRTIGKAAQVLRPGERVVIHAGIYREKVCPEAGGTSPAEMISYEAAEGEQVIISGAEVWQTEWTPSIGYKQRIQKEDFMLEGSSQAEYNVRENPDPQVWQGSFPVEPFAGVNPFAMTNSPSLTWQSVMYPILPVRYVTEEESWIYVMRRGLFFVDGKRQEQVRWPYVPWEQPGTFFIEDDGLTLHFSLKDHKKPQDCLLEYTAREQGFVPAKRGLGYIRLKGLRFEKYGNGFFPPQKGAVSTNCGHHWIIEDCEVDWANCAGIDVGFLSHHHWQEGIRGHHIIRRNTISHCGITGVCGLPLAGYHMDSMLVEDNDFYGNSWHDAEKCWECSSIKLHRLRNSIIRGNRVWDVGYGSAIWADYLNVNTRITGNICIGVKSAIHGCIFVEASQEPNLVDHNLVMNVGKGRDGEGGNGIYEHDCDKLRVENNIILGARGTAIQMHFGEYDRIVDGRGSLGRGMCVTGNLIADCGAAITFPNADNFADRNYYGQFPQPGGEWKIENPERFHSLQSVQEVFGWERGARKLKVCSRLTDDRRHLTLELTWAGETRVFELDFANRGCVPEFFEKLEEWL